MGAPTFNDAASLMIVGILRGTVCAECGEDIESGHSCPACAEKRELLRQAFPALYGDA
jgi:hypothetical protein